MFNFQDDGKSSVTVIVQFDDDLIFPGDLAFALQCTAQKDDSKDKWATDKMSDIECYFRKRPNSGLTRMS